MTILDKIIEVKRQEVSEAQNKNPIEKLKDQTLYHRETLSLESALNKNLNIISEFKRQSPSKGIINAHVDIKTTTENYERNGASALSILTDKSFFGGSNQDIIDVRDHINIPILRKEFIIDTYQIYEAKSIGADAILLIASCLSPLQVKEYTDLAKSLNLDVLLELHNEEELNHIGPENKLIGINNRNLKTFDVSLDHSIHLRNQLPNDCIAIAESGIHSEEDVKNLMNNRFSTFLIGEYFMKEDDPGLKLNTLIHSINDNYEAY